ncbi:MAG TPA: hypothetical protein VE988_04675 [Gemmataceae bacterium]|nr:hypothetical protein [Gemmataceae bacterium]
MRQALFIVVLTAGLLPAGGQPPAAEKERAAEIEWVKRSTGEFLDALLSWETGDLLTSSIVYLAPELAAAEKDRGAGQSGFLKVAWQFLAGKYRFTGAEISPNGNEIILEGELIPASEKDRAALDKMVQDELVYAKHLGVSVDNFGPRATLKAEFTLRVARDSGAGRWLIRSMSMKKREVVKMPIAK